MFVGQPLVSPYRRVDGTGIARHAVIAHKHKNGVVKITFLLRGLDEFTDTIIRIPECVEFPDRAKPVFLQGVGVHRHFVKIGILLRNGAVVRVVIA